MKSQEPSDKILVDNVKGTHKILIIDIFTIGHFYKKYTNHSQRVGTLKLEKSV